MSDDTFSAGSPISTGTFKGWDDYLDPGNIMHDQPNPEQSFAGQLAKPGAARDLYDPLKTPTQKDAGQAAIDAQMDSIKHKALTNTTLTSARGILEGPKSAGQMIAPAAPEPMTPTAGINRPELNPYGTTKSLNGKMALPSQQQPAQPLSASGILGSMMGTIGGGKSTFNSKDALKSLSGMMGGFSG